MLVPRESVRNVAQSRCSESRSQKRKSRMLLHSLSKNTRINLSRCNDNTKYFKTRIDTIINNCACRCNSIKCNIYLVTNNITMYLDEKSNLNNFIVNKNRFRIIHAIQDAMLKRICFRNLPVRQQKSDISVRVKNA